MYKVIIILGSANDDAGNLSPSSLERADKGIAEYRNNPGSKILATGGFGDHFNTTDQPHALHVKSYLIGQGVDEDDILPPAVSKDTIEDAVLAKEILQGREVSGIILVTSDFHMDRSKFIFSRVFPEYRITYVEAVSLANPEKMKKLLQHEKESMAKLLDQGIIFRGEKYA